MEPAQTCFPVVSNREAETNCPSVPSQGLSSVSEDNGAVEPGSQLHGSRSDHEAAAVESLIHLANSDGDVALLRFFFSLLPSTSDISDVKSKMLGMWADDNAFQTELSHVCHVVVGILQDLRRRDCRFIYLQEAMAEFLNENVDLGTRMFHYNQQIDSALSDNNYDDYTAISLDLFFLFQIENLGFLFQIENLQDVLIYRRSLLVAMVKIVWSVIYEILDVFDFEITAQESILQHNLPAYLTLLHRLCDKTKDCEPKPIKQTTHSLDTQKHNSHFIYQTELDPATDQTRVLKLSPGSGDDDIECSLEVYSIREDGIPEALSYAWGEELPNERILVDSQYFFITKNLLEILRALRCSKTPRTIWIDAICIDQANNKERAHQVRLMRDIYSQAQNTTVYLTTVKLILSQTRQFFTPLPQNFGGITVDQLDIQTIMHEFQEYPNYTEVPWCRRQLALFVMLIWSVEHIMSYAWWERIWTLQEAALAKSSPIFIFQGHSCTFKTLQSAIEIIGGIMRLPNVKHILGPINLSQWIDEMTPKAYDDMQKIIWEIGDGDLRIPLLFSIRQHEQHSDDFPSKHLYDLVNGTAAYRATDPRDKIYALQSLLPRCTRKLIRIDYNEDYKMTFTRTTAHYISSEQRYDLAAQFNLLIESATIFNKSSAAADGEATAHPSWALDFSYSDAAKSETHNGTLSQYLMRNVDYIREFQKRALNPIFVTPTTLFCDGIVVDYINKIGTIVEDGDPDWVKTVFRLANQIHRRIRRTHLNSGVGPDAVFTFLNLSFEADEFPKKHTSEVLAERLKAVVGKPYFITKNGLLGIATAPVRKGDSLCLLDGVHVYFILRKVSKSKAESQSSSSKAARRHRIVARAAIRGVNLPSPRESFPTHRFQII